MRCEIAAIDNAPVIDGMLRKVNSMNYSPVFPAHWIQSIRTRSVPARGETKSALFLSLFVALAFTTTSLTSTASAASIVGTIGFNIQGNVSSGATDLKPSIKFTNVRTNNTATDNWTAFTSGHVSGGMLAMDELTVGEFSSVGKSLSFSNAGFGSFTGTVIVDEIQSVGVGFLRSSTRLVKVSGFFNPGTSLVQSGYQSRVISQISIFFQGFTGGFRAAPGARSGTIVMSTQPVPEPGTIAMLVAGSATLFGMMRRRKTSQAV